jgi:hypothetical protein
MTDLRSKWASVFQCSAFAVLLLAGCGQKQAASLTGTVTLDGKPLTTGTVAFQPVAGGPLSYAGIHPDGSYKVSTGTDRGLPAGEYAVTVVASEPPSNASGGMAVGRLLTPTRYGKAETSDLQFKVSAGNNQIDLRLTSP